MKMLQRLDYIATLFKGILTWNELLNLPIYYFDQIVEARLKQLEESQKIYKETGHANIYMQPSEGAASLATAMGAGLAASTAALEKEEKEAGKKPFTQKDFLKKHAAEFQKILQEDLKK